MLAAVLAARNGVHFVFRWVTLALPGGMRVWLRQAVNLLVVMFLGVIVVKSLTLLDIVANQTAPATRLNMRVPFLGVTVGAAALLIVYLLEVLDAACSTVTSERLSRREQQEADVYALLTDKTSPLDTRTDAT
jgi:TRAP-type C4-dicarboxylate transport system permease small subunit